MQYQSLSSCNQVKISKRRLQLPKIPIGAKIYGLPQSINGYKIIFANPLPCVITTTTVVDIVEHHEIVEEKLEKNYHITIVYEDKEEHYIFPKKVWEIIRDRYIEPLRKGEPPIDPGFLLYGSPGTGKTSMIELIADVLGLHTVKVTSDDVLSKWVGESEKNIAKKMEEAENTEPSILIIDDAEWLVRSRDFVGTDFNNIASILSIILERLQRWKKKGNRIITAVATNISPNKIDPALLRAGRLGRPIFFPLPDLEAIEKMIEIHGVEEKKGREVAEGLKRKLLSYGVNMSDVVQAIHDVLEGREPTIEQFIGRGYIRPYNPHNFEELVRKKGKKAIFSIEVDNLVNQYTRLYFPASEIIGIPIITSFLNTHGITAILVKDYRYIDEILATAEASRSMILVPTSVEAGKDVTTLIYHNAKTGIIWIGSRKPPFPVFELRNLTSIMSSIENRKEVINSVLSYYDIKLENEKVRKLLLNYSEKTLVSVLERLALYKSGGVVKEEELAWLGT